MDQARIWLGFKWRGRYFGTKKTDARDCGMTETPLTHVPSQAWHDRVLYSTNNNAVRGQ